MLPSVQDPSSQLFWLNAMGLALVGVLALGILRPAIVRNAA